MKRKWQIFAIVLLASGLASTSAYGQSEDDKVGSVGFRFLNLGFGARPTAMGQAYTSMVDDALAVFWNPGGLGSVENFSINFTHSEYLVETNYQAVAAADYLEGIGTVGVGLTLLDYGDIIETEFPGVGDSDPRTGNLLDASDFALGVSFARKLSDQFSLGITAKFFQEDLAGVEASGVAFDIGTMFDTGYKGIKIGAAMTNFGPDVGFSGNGFESEQDLALPQAFRIGISMDSKALNDNENFVVTGTVDLVKNADTIQRFPVGVEVMISKVLMLRGGYVLGFDEGSYSLGAGVHVSKFQIDYSLSKLEDFDATDIQRFSIGIDL
ncbi:MAG: PorV/PorQ family protein [bacterium]